MYYEVYMDVFFLENFCLDFLLPFLTGIAAKLPVRFGRMAHGQPAEASGAVRCFCFSRMEAFF